MSIKRLSPSILNADFGNLTEVIRAVEGYADMLHLDVMDGHFVPNLTFGPMVVETVNEITNLPLDCHLMIYEPAEWVESFSEAGADRIAVHIRACRDVENVIDNIKHHEVTPGLAISPGTPLTEIRPYLDLVDFVVVMCVYPGFGGQQLMPEMLERVEKLRLEAGNIGKELELEVDGGVKEHNLEKVLEAGADTIVVGSSIFKSEDISAAAEAIKARIMEFNSRASNKKDTGGQNDTSEVRPLTLK